MRVVNKTTMVRYVQLYNIITYILRLTAANMEICAWYCKASLTFVRGIGPYRRTYYCLFLSFFFLCLSILPLSQDGAAHFFF